MGFQKRSGVPVLLALSLSRRFSLSLATLGLAAAASVASLPGAVVAAPRAPDFVSIKDASVNVCEKPTTPSNPLWEMGAGYPLQITQRKGQWLRVKDFEGPMGWVYAPLTSHAPHMVVTARNANLRAGPGTQHRRVGCLEQHEVVKTLKKSGSWAQVLGEGDQKGWIARRLAWGW